MVTIRELECKKIVEGIERRLTIELFVKYSKIAVFDQSFAKLMIAE